jgi:hypothetical protein
MIDCAMAKRPTAEMIAEGLSVSERVLLFCLASATDWQRAGVTHATTQQMMIRGLIEREAAGSFSLTDQGRAALEALMIAGGNERVTARAQPRDPSTLDRRKRIVPAGPQPGQPFPKAGTAFGIFITALPYAGRSR